MTKKKRILSIVIFIVSVLFVGAFIYLTPYSHDDWAWGDQKDLKD